MPWHKNALPCVRCVFSDQSAKYLSGVAVPGEAYQGSVATAGGCLPPPPSFFFFKNLLSYFNSTSSCIYTVPPLSCAAVRSNKTLRAAGVSAAQPAVCTSSHAPQDRPGKKGAPPPFQKEPRTWSETPPASFSSGKLSVKCARCRRTQRPM